jgi:hypothetical protein
LQTRTPSADAGKRCLFARFTATTRIGRVQKATK